MPYQTVNGIQLYYELHGPEDGFPLVFINGLLMDTTSWGFQLPVFAQHFRVLVYDCRGQGRSDKPQGPYPQAAHAQDLLGLLDALHIYQSHIIGLSNGGTVAMHFTSDHPDRVAHLVLIDTFAYADAVMRSKLDSWLVATEMGGLHLRFDVAMPWIWGRTFMTNNPDILASLRARVDLADPVAGLHLIRGTLDYDIRDRLSRVTAPALIMVGEEDVLTPPWYSRQLAQALPNAQLVIVPDAGHALTIERPDIVNALAVTFLQSYLIETAAGG
jgi:3-oxoadipate enol-lactonase